MLYISVAILLIALILVLKSLFEELHMNSFENKINKEIDELRGDEE